MGLKLFPLSLVSCQGVPDFPGVGGGWLKLFQGVRFFLIDCEFILGGRGI